MVLRIDKEKERLSLGYKQLTRDPWDDEIPSRYRVGDSASGKVSKVADFGIFVELDSGVEGLIHISELADHRVNHPKEVVNEGESLALRVVKIEPQERRMGLSLKRVASAEYADTDWEQVAAAIPDLDDVTEREA